MTKKKKNNFIGIQTRAALIGSFILIVVIAAVGFIFLYNERISLLKASDKICESLTGGLASIAIEGITVDERGVISDYLKNLKTFSPYPIEKAFVAEYGRTKNNTNVLTIIASTEYSQDGKILEKSENLVSPEANNLQKSRTITKGIPILDYQIPVIWKTLEKGKPTEFRLGIAGIRFNENSILQSYFATLRFTMILSLSALLIVLALVIVYLNLTHKLETTLKKVELLSVTDALTGIFNRKRFHETLQNEMHRTVRYGTPLSLIMFDIDHFKKINDTYGHDIGDAALIGTVTIVKLLIRDSDLFARWGGEEFMILIPDTDHNGALILAERIRKDIEVHVFDIIGHFTCSIGFTAYKPGETGDSFIKRVDKALYEAKESGRNRVVEA